MAKAVPYNHRADPNEHYRITREDARGRGTHHVYEFIVCKVCEGKYRPGTYASHKLKPEHQSKMTGHRKRVVVKPKVRARAGG